MFAGISVRGSGTDPRDYASAENLLRALAPYRQPDRAGCWQDNQTMIVQAVHWNTPESRHERAPEICVDTGRVIAGWLRIDNRAELCASLGLQLHETLTDPQLVLAAHRTWGGECADRLEGDFAFAIYDPARHETFCARDALGVRPFFYHASRGLFVFASTAAIFPVLERFEASPSREWAARFLAGESSDPVLSAYEQVRKLAPAHSLIVGREGNPEPRRYFAFVDSAIPASERQERWVDAYRATFHRAVEARLRSGWPIAAENSGGIDSGTIIGHVVSRLEGGGAHLTGFSVSHLEHEGTYIEAMADYCGLGENIVNRDPPYSSSGLNEVRALRVLGHPPQHSHALFHAPFLEICQKRGIRTLLSGFGGDELVTSQADFVLRELWLSRQYRALFDCLHGNTAARILRMGRVWQRGRGGGMGSTRTPRLANSILSRDALAIIPAKGIGEKTAEALATARTLNDHLLAKPGFRDVMTGRLEGCSLVAASYGVDYRWPMLDRALISQYLRTPAIEKRHAHWGRYLHRRACDGTIPDTVLWKQSKHLGGFVAFEPDRVVPKIDIDALPEFLAELIDREAVDRQTAHLSRVRADDARWLAASAERNNLNSLRMLANWLKPSC